MRRYEKWLLLGLAGIVALQVLWPKEERFVSLANKTLPKAVCIAVDYRIMVTNITFDLKRNKLDLERKEEDVKVSGAGVFISPNGQILTCAHLFTVGGKRGAINVTTWSGAVYTAELLYKDEQKDLALLRLENGGIEYSYAKLANPFSLKIGQEVLAIGNPLGFEFSVSHGIISALYRDLSLQYNMTQSDAFINPGNSGGPLFNLKGELIGINTNIVSPVNAPIFTGLGFSVQCGQLLEFLTKFKGLERSYRG